MCKDMRDSKKSSTEDSKHMANNADADNTKSTEKSTEHPSSSHKGCGCGGY